MTTINSLKVKLLESNIKTPIELSNLPEGIFKYCSKTWVDRILKSFDETLALIDKLCKDIDNPRISYTHYSLKVGEKFGHGKMHTDGYGKETELHRLLTFNGTPTLGEDNAVLYANNIWEFRGDYYHQARPALQHCDRLLLRVSLTDMPFRNRWELNLPVSINTCRQF